MSIPAEHEGECSKCLQPIHRGQLVEEDPRTHRLRHADCSEVGTHPRVLEDMAGRMTKFGEDSVGWFDDHDLAPAKGNLYLIQRAGDRSAFVQNLVLSGPVAASTGWVPVDLWANWDEVRSFMVHEMGERFWRSGLLVPGGRDMETVRPDQALTDMVLPKLRGPVARWTTPECEYLLYEAG